MDYTYEEKGAKRVAINQLGPALSKRQCTAEVIFRPEPPPPPPLDAPPEVRKKWPPELRDMLTACWSLESAKRPDFRTIVPRLSTMLEAQEIRELPKKERKRLQEAGKLSPRATPGGHEGGVRKRIDADIETMDS